MPGNILAAAVAVKNGTYIKLKVFILSSSFINNIIQFILQIFYFIAHTTGGVLTKAMFAMFECAQDVLSVMRLMLFSNVVGGVKGFFFAYNGKSMPPHSILKFAHNSALPVLSVTARQTVSWLPVFIK